MPTALATEGEFAGWNRWVGDPFEDAVGPFFFRTAPDGRPVTAFRAEPKHMNAGGHMHGGCLMAVADMALFTIAREALGGQHGVTVALDSVFLNPGNVGDLVEATGEVTRAGGSLIFVRGQVTVEDRNLLTFSGVIKKLRPRPEA
jgi:uncharacterized protein (TIGR00369 family)